MITFLVYFLFVDKSVQDRNRQLVEVKRGGMNDAVTAESAAVLSLSKTQTKSCSCFPRYFYHLFKLVVCRVDILDDNQ